MRLCPHRLFSTVAIVAANLCAVAPLFAAGTVCNFRAKGLSLNFGVLNPSIVQNISKPITVATTFANQAGDCTGGGNMAISIVGSSSRQLVNGPNTINYTISGLPVSLPKPGNAPNRNQAAGFVDWFTSGQLQGTILWSAYADAPAGNYTDSITVSVNH